MGTAWEPGGGGVPAGRWAGARRQREPEVLPSAAVIKLVWLMPVFPARVLWGTACGATVGCLDWLGSKILYNKELLPTAGCLTGNCRAETDSPFKASSPACANRYDMKYVQIDLPLLYKHPSL